MGGVLLVVGGSVGVMATVGCLRGVILLWAVDEEACLYCGRYLGVILLWAVDEEACLYCGWYLGVILLWAVDEEACLYCRRYFGWCFVSCGWLSWCDGDSGLLEGRDITVGSR